MSNIYYTLQIFICKKGKIVKENAQIFILCRQYINSIFDQYLIIYLWACHTRKITIMSNFIQFLTTDNFIQFLGIFHYFSRFLRKCICVRVVTVQTDVVRNCMKLSIPVFFSSVICPKLFIYLYFPEFVTHN